jgi:hypothetical protein
MTAQSQVKDAAGRQTDRQNVPIRFSSLMLKRKEYLKYILVTNALKSGK